MTTKKLKTLAPLLLLLPLALLAQDALGDGVALVSRSKSLPEATVAVIDPETGSSAGGEGGDVKLAEGDIILFRFAFAPVPNKVNRGLQAYMTDYIPDGTEVVGVRFIDNDGRTIEPRLPGLGADGCPSGSPCTEFDDLPCTTGTGCTAGVVDLHGGTVSQVHADTGVFFTSDARLNRNPSSEFISYENGTVMDPEPTAMRVELAPLLNISEPFYAHNAWDYDQVLAFGISNTDGNFSRNQGKGNTPYRYGSPVAGPQTFYMFEATDAGGDAIKFDGQLGPWSRIKYPGSMVGFGGCIDNASASAPACSGGVSDEYERKSMPAEAASHCGATGDQPCVGVDVTPAAPVSASAVRFALGESRTGVGAGAEIALRVKPGGVPIDSLFGASGGNVNCMETSGANIARRGTGNDGDNNPWGSYIGSPACVFLRLLLDLTADRGIALGGDPATELVTYTLRVKNLSVDPETSAVVYQRWDGSGAFEAWTGGLEPVDHDPTAAVNYVASCPAPYTGQCLTWDLGTLDPSEEYTITTQFSVGGAGGGTFVMEAIYDSAELPTEDFRTHDVTVIKAIALPDVSIAPAWDPITSFIAGDGSVDATFSGTISNDGTAKFTYDTLNLVLPSGWSLSGNQIVVGGTAHACTPAASSTPSCTIGLALDPGQSQTLGFALDVPPGTSTALYPFDIQFVGSQPSFGGNYETYLPKIGTVNVGAVRTAKPIIDCPVAATQPSVSGDSEDDADVVLRFNMMPRGTDTADGSGAWEVTSYDAFGPFGDMYGGLELTAVATAPTKLVSEPSDPCDVTPSRECSDGFDNDDDGLVDFPADPGCDSPTDNDETEDVLECSDGIDNPETGLPTGDGDTDYPDDLSCQDEFDDSEEGPPACSDGIDNDGDTLVDFPEDMGCDDANDQNEIDFAACQNGIDDDGDGDVDFPDDTGCHSAFDDDERTSCQNGVDDDGDGDVDFPDDADCEDVFDDNEADVPADIKARLLIVFDSSGSMNYNTCTAAFTGGDGSTDCPGSDVPCSTCNADGCGDGLANDSRMAKVKDGISSVIAAFGEVEYGLMRFHQRAELFECPGTNAGLRAGGWQGAGLLPCGGGFDAGDLLVGFTSDNQYALLSWMDGDTNYPGDAPPRGMDQELRGSGATPLAGALGSALTYLQGVQADDDQRACRPYRVILVTDGGETCGGNPNNAAKLLADAGFQVEVIGFATSDGAIIASLDDIADHGDDGLDNDSTTAIIASDSTALSTAMIDIINETLLFERCNGIDDDCDFPLVDEDFPELGNSCSNGERGICHRTGVFVCAADELGVECNAPPGTPGVEECNGLDDDCDGLIDEGFPASCVCIPSTEVCNGADDDCDGQIDENVDELGDPELMPGVGGDCGIDLGECTFGSIECVSGVLTCTGGTGPVTEICDGLDNDCDTLVDEISEPCYDFASGCDLDAATCEGLCRIGLRECVGGAPGECVGDVGPVGEKCNAIDDDCDGLPDEDFNVGDACDNGLLGACLVVGTYQCTPDGSGTYCTAFPVTPGIEICNGLDDDCDGLIDEDLGAPVGNSCGEGTACSGGTLQCIDGALSCEGATGGSAEICNAIDDDCDSLIDEDVPGEGDDCTDEGFEAIGDTGECEFGVTQCIAGDIVCVDYQGPRPETCNGVDDNCDGEVDNEAVCPSPDDICVEGTCIFQCEMSEFPCPLGFLCKDFGDQGRFCVPDPCRDVTCPDSEVCNSDNGECEDPCDSITCPPGTTCSLGGCYDCFDAGFECEEGQLCVFDSGTQVGQCQDDPCFDVSCADDEFCREGECVAVTCEPECALDERCVEGVCVDDPCAGKDCGEGRVCDPDSGRCVSDPCENVVCPPGQACNPATSRCESDPCSGIQCPDGFDCRLTLEGEATCVRPPEPPVEEIFAAGAGCECSVGDDRVPGAGSWLLVLLAGVFLTRRRRR